MIRGHSRHSYRFPATNANSATLDLNFAGTAALPATVTFSRGTNATFTNSAGNIQLTAGINDARFDYDPITLVCKGLLIEEARTNSIRNNTMQGAVVGTPGTPPTNWFFDTSLIGGLTTSVVGVGVENGITYIDLRAVGTATTTNSMYIVSELSNTIAASTGQVWTASHYCKLVGGSLTGISFPVIIIQENTAVGTFLANTVIAVAFPTSASLITQRVAGTATLNNALTARVISVIGFTVTSGAAINATLRIGLPQLEQGAFATSVIPTTAAAATRNADVAVMTGTNFSSWYNQTQGTFVTQTDQNQLAASSTYPGFYTVSNGTIGNSIATYTYNLSNIASTTIASATNFNLLIASGLATAGATVKTAVAYAAANFAASSNGLTPVSKSTGNIPTVDRIELGYNSQNVTNYLNGHIARITYYPTRLPNATLQALTAPPPTTGFAVKSAAGTSYSTTRNVLSAAGTSYAVSATVLSANGTSYTPI